MESWIKKKKKMEGNAHLTRLVLFQPSGGNLKSSEKDWLLSELPFLYRAFKHFRFPFPIVSWACEQPSLVSTYPVEVNRKECSPCNNFIVLFCCFLTCLLHLVSQVSRSLGFADERRGDFIICSKPVLPNEGWFSPLRQTFGRVLAGWDDSGL